MIKLTAATVQVLQAVEWLKITFSAPKKLINKMNLTLDVGDKFIFKNNKKATRKITADIIYKKHLILKTFKKFRH